MDNGASSYLRFLNGDESGFVEIVNEYRDGLVLFISSFTGDLHGAEESADETFLKLFVDKPRFKPQYSFKTWLFTIGRNLAVDRLRKQKNSVFATLEDYYYISDETDIEAEYIKSEERQRLHRTIKSLKPEYAQVLYLMYFEDLSTAEAARVMGKSTKQISNLIFRAKNSLRTKLEKEGEHEQE